MMQRKLDLSEYCGYECECGAGTGRKDIIVYSEQPASLPTSMVTSKAGVDWKSIAGARMRMDDASCASQCQQADDGLMMYPNRECDGDDDAV